MGNEKPTEPLSEPPIQNTPSKGLLKNLGWSTNELIRAILGAITATLFVSTLAATISYKLSSIQKNTLKIGSSIENFETTMVEKLDEIYIKVVLIEEKIKDLKKQ